MSKKHFVKLAEALKSSRPGDPRHSTLEKDYPQTEQWNIDVERITEVCALCNPLFDRSRFITACGGLFE